MIGTWDIEVTLRNRATGESTQTLRAVDTFTSGGALIQTGAHSALNLSSPGQGVWRHMFDHRYAAVLRFFRFNPDGSVAETHKVTRQLELSSDRNRFTGTASVEVFDSDESLVTAHCATEVGTRFEFLPGEKSYIWGQSKNSGQTGSPQMLQNFSAFWDFTLTPNIRKSPAMSGGRQSHQLS